MMKAYNKRKSEDDENTRDTKSAKRRKLGKETDEIDKADVSDKYVLVEDSDEEDIVFRTPPQTVKSTILSLSKTPTTQKTRKSISQPASKAFTELISDESVLSPVTMVKAKGKRKSLPSNRTRTRSAHVKKSLEEPKSASLCRRAESGRRKNTPTLTTPTGSKAKTQRKVQRRSV